MIGRRIEKSFQYMYIHIQWSYALQYKLDYPSDHYQRDMCLFDIHFINDSKKMYRTDRKDKIHQIDEIVSSLSIDD